MRRVICALVLLAAPSIALAGDFDVLRGAQSVGPANFPNWSGYYVGGQATASDATADFTTSTRALVAQSLAELQLESVATPSAWPVLGKASTSAWGYGGYAGYNSQWQDMILGVEVNYTHEPMAMVAANTPILNRVVAVGSNDDSVNVTGTGTLNITDYASLRARAGWIFGNFLPYGFAGLAFGRADYAVTSHVFGQQNLATATPPVVPCNPLTVPTCVNYDATNSSSKNSVVMYGFSVGGGLEMAVVRNVILRGEFEYVQFAPISGITASIANLRGGVAYKF
jgi:outer membrane immunogenic protein